MIPKIEVSESVKQQGMDMAKQLSGSYNAPTMTIAEVEGKPEGTVFTLTAEVTEIDDAILVKTMSNAEIYVRNGYLGDSTSGIAFAFWRNLAETELKVGDTVHIANAVRSVTSDGQPKLTGGKYTTVTKLDVSPFTSVIRPKQTGSKTASVIGLSSFKKYESCPNKTCFGKKLLNNTCPNCKKTYNEKESTMSVVCSVMLEDDEHNFDQVSLFTKQVTEISSLDLTKSEQSLQEDFVKCLPCKINYTKSPKKDSTIVQLRKC